MVHTASAVVRAAEQSIGIALAGWHSWLTPDARTQGYTALGEVNSPWSPIVGPVGHKG